jgi:hypothetical protein
VVDEINCQLSIIIIISFSFNLTLCAYRIMKSREKKTFFLSLCVKLLLLRKDEESSEWYATSVYVCGWRKEKEKRAQATEREGGSS